MNISTLIHEQACKVDAIETTVRAEKGYLEALKNFKYVIDEYKKENHSQKFYPWCVTHGYALDFDEDIMELVDKVEI